MKYIIGAIRVLLGFVLTIVASFSLIFIVKCFSSYYFFLGGMFIALFIISVAFLWRAADTLFYRI